MTDQQTLVEVKDLRTYFLLDEGTVHAVDGANLSIKRGRTLGVVGESGCGKSVTGQSIMRIVPPPGKIVDGQILFNRYTQEGASEFVETVDLTALNPRGRQIRAIRGAEIAMVFQEPMTSLGPVHTIGNQIMEAIILHQKVSQAEARERAVEMLHRVGMPKPAQTIDNYPYELSGGMRQRAVIAMALSCHPSMLIADEPTTALDVTTEAQILELMQGLQDELGMAILFITHNLGVIAEMAEDVVVMYMGKVVEQATVDAMFFDPQHPYTKALLKSIPHIGRKSRQRLEAIEGMVPDPYAIPSGCPFHPRCRERVAGLCDREEPPWVQLGDDHWFRCHQGRR